MANKQIFKGFRFIDGTKEGFNDEQLEPDTINFVRTDNEGKEGYIKALGKTYGKTYVDVGTINCGEY